MLRYVIKIRLRVKKNHSQKKIADYTLNFLFRLIYRIDAVHFGLSILVHICESDKVMSETEIDNTKV